MYETIYIYKLRETLITFTITKINQDEQVTAIHLYVNLKKHN